ncbi:MAG: hypothetical protein M9925_08395 [Chloroflexi bacterium]|jgi:hypothetical protein|nr:hypothetical protein [Dehalococcoidia bacterium]MCO5201702.1 hypothetical protein [Chloroflexota bacterium]NJD65969.1 hypothetical protein [Chloroflexota bacterium]PWB45017.1 MAG: hypothetical protein C3F10_07365 [Dehalococcoidia bacterium]
MANDQVQKYYNSLLASYDVLVDAVTRANERGFNVTKQFASDVAKGQREAIELGKKLAAEPADLSHVYAAVLEATTAAQGRALAFTQAAYQDALTAGGDARELVQKLVEVNKETAQAAVEVARTWATANPVVDVMKKSFESMQPATKESKKKGEKAAV